MNIDTKAATIVMAPSRMNSHLFSRGAIVSFVGPTVGCSCCDSLPRRQSRKTVHSLLDTCADQSGERPGEQRASVKLEWKQNRDQFSGIHVSNRSSTPTIEVRN